MLYSSLLKTVFRAVYGPLPEPTGQDDDRAGLTVVLDGVGGLDLCGTGLQYMVAGAKMPMEVKVVRWGHGLGRWHADLTNVANHTAQAEMVAHLVGEFRARKPEAPVYLVGKSGGTGLVVGALERLPAETVEATVLLSSAISPGYDLSRALKAVRREMVVFWSPLDVFVLGLGTKIFGTIDRARTASAGLVGFSGPEKIDARDPAQYNKLRQIRWNPSMWTTGYLGGHVGPDSPAFLRKYVLPILGLAAEPPSSFPTTSSEPRPAPIT